MNFLKKISPVILIVVTIVACTNSADEPSEDTMVEETQDSVYVVAPDSLLVFEVDAEARTLKRDTVIQQDFITAERVVNGLNQKYSMVPIVLQRTGNDTIYIQVTNNEYLGHRMGSAGAAAWTADAVFNLTAVPGINYVYIDMEPGSHASPGVWTRSSFKNFKEIE